MLFSNSCAIFRPCDILCQAKKSCANLISIATDENDFNTKKAATGNELIIDHCFWPGGWQN